jgi:hypothetical protein
MICTCWDGAETGLLVNTGKLLILVDAGLVWRRSVWAVAKQPPQDRQRKGNGSIWAPVAFTDKWGAKGRINHSGTDANEEQDYRFGLLPKRSA